jgi:hypothetical protein
LENKVYFLSVGKYAAPPFQGFRPPPHGVAPHSLRTTGLGESAWVECVTHAGTDEQNVCETARKGWRNRTDTGTSRKLIRKILTLSIENGTERQLIYLYRDENVLVLSKSVSCSLFHG